ncbi:MAG: beta-propeller fold lactonase family protein [Erysipelotrichaceae bacterium]|nr:beta-propeller fold lactonase family protein [Erysipelotrichaceae bacterium]
MDIYSGTYTGAQSRGIYRVCFDDGILHDPVLYCQIGDPKYLCRHDDSIVSIFEEKDGAGVALIEDGKITDRCVFEKKSSCFVTCRDDLIYTANYHEGTFSMLEEKNGRLELLKTVEVKKGCGCHQILFHEDRILVPCLFLDRMLICDQDLEKIGEIVFPEGSGPRHGAFTDDGRYLYLLAELNSHLYRIDTDSWKIVSDIPLYDDDIKDAAAVRIREGYVYCSSRARNEIVVVSMNDDEVIQHADCHGLHPRDFMIAGDNLICANRFSNELVSMQIEEDGTIGDVTGRVNVPEAVALIK